MAPAHPQPYLLGASGTLYAASLYGYGEEGPQLLSGEAHARSASVQKALRSEAYFRNRQHDGKAFSWSGKVLASFEPGHQPLLKTAKLDYHVPLDERRPCAPYRLAPFIVRSFTSLLFGEGRDPEIRVVGDPDTQDFHEALAREMRLWERFRHARNVGGSSGTVGVSWRFWQGKPRLQVHPRSSLHVQSWADREELIPEVVSEIVQVEREVYDEESKKIVNKRFWRRRDWTPLADVVFVDQRCDSRDKSWIVDDSEGATVVHGEGFAHFRWIANADDYDGSCPEGEPDYAGQEEACDAIDMACSGLMHGGTKNLEPTLLLKIEEAILQTISNVHKGSDNALPVGEKGDANYLEISGASIDAGIKLVGFARGAVLEACQVVAPDPDKVAAAGSSSVAQRMLYAPMLAPASGLRSTYGRAAVGLLQDMERSIRMRQPIAGEDGELTYPIAPSGRPAEPPPEGETDHPTSMAGDQGEAPEEPPVEEDLYVDLPPRVVEEQVTDPETGEPTGEVRTRVEPRKLGKGGEISLHWPEWFPLTPDDRAKEVGTLSTGSGGKAVLPQKAAVERAAALYDLDPKEAWAEVAKQRQAEAEAEAGMFPPAGDVEAPAPPAQPPEPEEAPPARPLKPTPFRKRRAAPPAAEEG